MNKKMLKISGCNTFEKRRFAVQSALIMGFNSESAEFPVISFSEGIPVPDTAEGLSGFIELHGQSLCDAPVGYISSTASAMPSESMEWRRRIGLECLFSGGDFFKDNDNDLLPDCLDFYMVLPEDVLDAQLYAACTLAFRFGMETTRINGWLLREKYTGGRAVLFRATSDDRIFFDCEAGEEAAILRICGCDDNLKVLADSFCGSFPNINEFETWTHRLRRITDDLCMRRLDGQLAHLQAELDRDPDALYEVLAPPEIKDRRDEVEKAFPTVRFCDHKEMIPVWDETFDIEWEVDELRRILNNDVYPLIKAGDRINLACAVSEEKSVRDQIAKEIKAEIAASGAQADEVSVLCAYKQGYSWFGEDVLPKLKALKNGSLARLDIAFKPFTADGSTEWSDDVNGSQPSYFNAGSGCADTWYDLPIRFLQELYPIDDTLSDGLGIDRDAVVFSVYKGGDDITYRCTASDGNGNILFSDDYLCRYSERTFLDEFPKLGLVHPDTGYISLCTNGEHVFEKRIATDLENVWDIYQNKVLPSCRAQIIKRFGANPGIEAQPLFSQLHLNLTLSEPDENLASRQDLLSSLDALHEDLYFAGADYFKHLGMELVGKPYDAPGLILPKIKKGLGKPGFNAILYNQRSQEPQIIKDGKVIARPKKRDDISCFLIEARNDGGRLSAVMGADGASEAVVKAYAALSEKNLITSFHNIPMLNHMTLRTDSGTYHACLHDSYEKDEPLDINAVEIPEDKLIGYEDCLSILKKLARVPGLAVRQTGESYTGRKLYAVEIVPDARGYISRTKRITNHPSLYINNRHHANEISSTNASLLLIKRLLTDEKYRNLTQKLNIVIVPMENVDGTAIHEELQRENPVWKLHTARFNSIGKEFYHEHFLTDPISPEALPLQNLYYTFLPDVMLDNHGVPSHEWDQQFSGYTSPSYKGFWLPRALLYGCCWLVNSNSWRSNLDLCKALEDRVCDAIASSDEMSRWNSDFAAAFKHYANDWMPNMFPADYYRGLIMYDTCFDFNPQHRYSSIRFPWITSAAFTSEVADETAKGDYLGLCTRTHLAHNTAIVDMLLDARLFFDRSVTISEESMEIRHIRQRPIVAK